ncbi:uncharacterized protein LOC114476419 isoform X1 [Gouania willdenowi]|uniref:uncharacterized protein LOC114476419 isoform X1 n=1 Tax=Gouania willdenowi TaxID=441366 RepID=UPI001056CD6F|nr:uncharacterized protein LOC114476419 isoform X1 [Gouania willdenowi]
MHRQFRPPNPSDGAINVKATEGSGTHPGLVAGASEQKTGHRSCGHSMLSGGGRGGEQDSPSWCTPHDGLSDGLYQSRRKYPLSSRSSSGYISDGESLPSSPQTTRPVMADKATQTPSLTGQVVMHALHRMAEDGHAGPRTPPGHDSFPESGPLNSTMEAQAETFGRELRLIGDDYNRLLISRSQKIIMLRGTFPHSRQQGIHNIFTIAASPWSRS